MKTKVLTSLSIIALLFNNEVYSIKHKDIKHASSKLKIANNTLQLKQTNN